jgi:hypothetical protein
LYRFHTKWSRSADCVSETTLEAFPDLAIASMLIGNVMLLFPKLTMAGLWICGRFHAGSSIRRSCRSAASPHESDGGAD